MFKLVYHQNPPASFLGAFPRDQLDVDKLRIGKTYPLCFIANTDTSDEPGQHWVAYYFHNHTHVTFFDSFGKPPGYYGFKHSTDSHITTAIYNPIPLQQEQSTTCGEHCVMFLLFSLRKCSLVDIIRLYQTHYGTRAATDKLVRSTVEHLIQKYQLTYDCSPDSCPIGSQCCTPSVSWCQVPARTKL